MQWVAGPSYDPGIQVPRRPVQEVFFMNSDWTGGHPKQSIAWGFGWVGAELQLVQIWSVEMPVDPPPKGGVCQQGWRGEISFFQ